MYFHRFGISLHLCPTVNQLPSQRPDRGVDGGTDSKTSKFLHDLNLPVMVVPLQICYSPSGPTGSFLKISSYSFNWGMLIFIVFNSRHFLLFILDLIYRHHQDISTLSATSSSVGTCKHAEGVCEARTDFQIFPYGNLSVNICKTVR